MRLIVKISRFLNIYMMDYKVCNICMSNMQFNTTRYKKGYRCLKGIEIKDSKDWKLYRREESYIMFFN